MKFGLKVVLVGFFPFFTQNQKKKQQKNKAKQNKRVFFRNKQLFDHVPTRENNNPKP